MLLTVGEIMLRLSPRRELLQTRRLDVWVAGAKANVATQLARLGHQPVRRSPRHRDPAGSRRPGARTAEIALVGIVDRIGGGDAFAAGVLHAMCGGGDIAEVARTGLALAALKHSLPGDAAPFRQADIDAYLAGGLDVRR